MEAINEEDEGNPLKKKLPISKFDLDEVIRNEIDDFEIEAQQISARKLKESLITSEKKLSLKSQSLTTSDKKVSYFSSQKNPELDENHL